MLPFKNKSAVALIHSLLKKVARAKTKKGLIRIDFDGLYHVLDEQEVALIKEFLNLNPRIYGFTGPKFGITKVPNNLIAIRNQKFKRGEKTEIIRLRYLPQPVYKKYLALSGALEKNTGKRLLVESGYRSPAYQAITFFRWLSYHHFDFPKTSRRVAFPGYSEHGYPKRQAIDFLTERGIPNSRRPLDFGKTVEYKWLIKNAAKFGFRLSYPRNNKHGVMYEPWHWSYHGKYSGHPN